jgi:hypothetical protein
VEGWGGQGEGFRQRKTAEAYTALAPPESSALAHSTDENPPAVRLTAVGRDGRVAEEVRRRRRGGAERGGAGRGQRACR